MPQGTPHNLGQFYLLIDPTTHANTLAARIEAIAAAVADEPNVRLPSTRDRARDPVTIDPALWAKITRLASRSTGYDHQRPP